MGGSGPADRMKKFGSTWQMRLFQSPWPVSTLLRPSAGHCGKSWWMAGWRKLASTTRTFRPARAMAAARFERDRGPPVGGLGTGDDQAAALVGRPAEHQAGANLAERLVDQRIGVGLESQPQVGNLFLQVVGMRDHAEHGHVDPPDELGGTLDRGVGELQEEGQAHAHDQPAHQAKHREDSTVGPVGLLRRRGMEAKADGVFGFVKDAQVRASWHRSP